MIVVVIVVITSFFLNTRLNVGICISNDLFMSTMIRKNSRKSRIQRITSMFAGRLGVFVVSTAMVS